MDYKPLQGNVVFNALKDEKAIILACNPRIIPGVAKGVFRAAKDLDAALIMELARTECNHKVGYTGLTPATFSKFLMEANNKVKHDIWVLHADHIGVKEGTPEEIQEIKEMITAQVKAGYTSFAIDASHLFNFKGKTIEEELEPNIKATIEIGNHIKKEMKGKDFGLEVEVGEIGRKDNEGMVLTKPKEAVTFIKKLTQAGFSPNLIAIANGSTHGNIYDEHGKLIAQTTINIKQTKAVAKALKDNGFDVRIAQHGITGTPLDIIDKQFPHGIILKGNVATLFQNIVFDALKKYHSDLYNEMFEWVLKNKPIAGKKTEEIFGKNSKYAPKVFFDRIYSMSEECKKEIEEESYKAASDHIKAFHSQGTASKVRELLSK